MADATDRRAVPADAVLRQPTDDGLVAEHGQRVNRKRLQRLMQVMGLEALYPKRRTTVPGEGHKIYPYLLRDLAIARPDQVWSADITYVPLRRGFRYLVAVLDWFSRYVLSWRLSNSLETTFCVEALEEALAGRRPEIFNTDQGVQFTSEAFTSRLQSQGVAISMDGRGRALDNVHRATVAKREARGHLPQGLPQRGRTIRRAAGILSVLRPPAAAPGFIPPATPTKRRTTGWKCWIARLASRAAA